MTTSALMKIGSCFSTVGYKLEFQKPERDLPIFNFPRVAQSLALATERAWEHLNHPQNIELLAGIDHDLKCGAIDSTRLILAGYSPKYYVGRQDWMTFGIRFFSPEAEEYGAYNEAEKLIYSPAQGVGRRIYFGIQGVEIEGINILEQLSEDHYKVLIGMIVENLQDPDFSKVSAIHLSKNQVLQKLRPSANDGRIILASEQLLERLASNPGQFRSAPKLEPITPRIEKEE